MVRYGLVQLGSVYKLFIFCYPKVRHFTLDFFRIAILCSIFDYNNEHRLKPSQMC